MAPRTFRKKKQQQSSVFFDGEMRCIEPKILEISLERKLQGKRFPKFRYKSHEVVFCFEILENPVPFATGKNGRFR